MKTIITIGREYGSGGKEIGEKLAAALSIPCYDKELLTEAAKESGISEDIFLSNDEKPSGSFLYSLVMGSYGSENLPFNHKLFLAQFDTIRSIADRGPCVIIGRCADYALEDYKNCLNVFIHAKMDFKIQRAVEYYSVPREKAQSVIVKTDKARASYYTFYSGKKWGAAENYHLTIDSSVIGIDKTVEIIRLAAEVLERE